MKRVGNLIGVPALPTQGVAVRAAPMSSRLCPLAHGRAVQLADDRVRQLSQQYAHDARLVGVVADSSALTNYSSRQRV